jgi:hypothetical protein
MPQIMKRGLVPPEFFERYYRPKAIEVAEDLLP